MGLDGVKIDGPTALLTGLKVPCEKVNELLSSKVAPQLLHSGRGRGGVAPAAAEAAAPSRRQQAAGWGLGKGENATAGGPL